MKFNVLGLVLFVIIGTPVLGQTDTLYKSLDSIVLVVNQDILKESARGAKLNVQKLPGIRTMSLADALSLIPGLEFSQDGSQITYLGKPVTKLRDGVKVAGFDKLIKATFNNPDISQYETIELNIYDLKTEQPSISFVMKKLPLGLFGSIGGNGGTNHNQLNTNVSIVTPKHLINLFESAGFFLFPSKTNTSEITYFNTGIKEQRLLKMNKIFSANQSAGISDGITISDKHIINASMSYSLAKSDYSLSNNRIILLPNGSADTVRNSVENNSKARPNYEVETSLTYTYKLPQGKNAVRRLDFSFEYDLKNEKSTSRAKADVFAPYSIYSDLSATRRENFFSLASYGYNHKTAGNFEAVIKYFNRNEKQYYNYEYQINLEGKDSTILQHNNINYQYGALLVSWDKALNPFSLRVVLKQDFSRDYIENDLGQTDKKFYTFSPYLSLFKKIKNSGIRFESQFSQSRPVLQQLSDIIQYGGQYNGTGINRIGNPNLVPAKNLWSGITLNTTIKQISLLFTGRYSYNWDVITPYRMAIDTTLIETFRNLRSSNNFKFTNNTSFYLVPRLSLNISSDISVGSYKQDKTTSQSTYNWSESVQLGYSFLPQFRVSLSANYSKFKIYQAQSIGQFSSGLSANYAIKKFSFILSATNLHKPYFYNETIVQTDTYYMYQKSRSRMLNIMVMASYRFGKARKNVPPGKIIIKDDM